MQSKAHSLLESITNIAIGLVINITAQHLIFPQFGIHIAFHDNIAIAIIFTVISLARSYTLRRLFNLKTYGQSTKEKSPTSI